MLDNAKRRLDRLESNVMSLYEPEVAWHTEALEEAARLRLRRDVQPWADVLVAHKEAADLDIWALSVVAFLGYANWSSIQLTTAQQVVAVFDRLWPYLSGVLTTTLTVAEETSSNKSWIVQRVRRMIQGIPAAREALLGDIGQAILNDPVNSNRPHAWSNWKEDKDIPWMSRYRSIHEPRKWTSSDMWLIFPDIEPDGHPIFAGLNEVVDAREMTIARRREKFPELAALVVPETNDLVYLIDALGDMMSMVEVMAPMRSLATWFMGLIFVLLPAAGPDPGSDRDMALEDATGYLANRQIDGQIDGRVDRMDYGQIDACNEVYNQDRMQDIRAAWSTLVERRAELRVVRERAQEAEKALHDLLGKSWKA